MSDIEDRSETETLIASSEGEYKKRYRNLMACSVAQLVLNALLFAWVVALLIKSGMQQ
jgi:hypothetical protein